MPPKKNNQLNKILMVSKINSKQNNTATHDTKKTKNSIRIHPKISLGELSEKHIDTLLTSVGSVYKLKCANTYFYPYNLLTNNLKYECRFNNQYQLIRIYKKNERVFEHGNVCFSLIKKGNKFLKRKVFIKELATIDHDTYIENIQSYCKSNPLYPNIYGNMFMNAIYSYNNPSYIDILCHYLCSRVTEEGILPHFPLFYGLINTVFDKYSYTFMDKSDYKNFIEKYELTDGYNDNILKIINKDDKDKVELSNFPVYLMATEVMDFDLDEFMLKTNESYEYDINDSFDVDSYEKTLFSVLFQTIISLIYIQDEWNMIHNDLHIGNIMFKSTEQKYINYCLHGIFYRVPTFGMIVKIIDWNRGCLNFNNMLIRNNVYNNYGDCSDMYYFPTVVKNSKSVVDINPSFDLAILAYEILDNDKIIDKSKSKFVKLLLDLLTMSDGNNIYNLMGGKEIDAGFDLYIKIAQMCHKAVPRVVIQKAIWNMFKVNKSVIPQNEKIYTI
jgi:hypothetical protein